MNLGHLAVFHAVAEAGSVSRGADRLMVSQPAVSKQFAMLERSLKTVLADRLPRGVRLTTAGELLAGYARRLFALEAEAERAMGWRGWAGGGWWWRRRRRSACIGCRRCWCGIGGRTPAWRCGWRFTRRRRSRGCWRRGGGRGVGGVGGGG